jgi:lipoprotein-anchoring transpeptidase ErfK/SrfK
MVRDDEAEGLVMRHIAAVCALAIAGFFSASAAQASMVIHIDKSTQQMSVEVDGSTRYVWAVSTGRAGYGTPSGTYRPQRMARSWFSRKYYNSPMPHSIFFHGGFAIHGSYEIRRLGGPASHGCVRLHPGNAATLYALVQSQGMGATRIVVSGSSPATPRNRPKSRYMTEPQYAPAPSFSPFGFFN